MKKPKTVTAAAFLVILACCLLLVLGGVVRVLLGHPTTSLSRYQPGPEGVTYTGLVDWFEDTCEAFCTEELPGRVALKEVNAAMNRLAGKWIFEGTEVIRLKNGYFTSVSSVNYAAVAPQDRVAAFRDFVEEELGVPYLYVQAPCKICEEDPQLPMEGMDNFNQQTTVMLQWMDDLGIDILDLRRNLHADGLDHYESFYVTDHHWTMETGLWAARTMAEELNERYSLGLDVSALDPDRFTNKVWEKAFLGSWGRKVTLAYAEPEDFVLPTPIEPVDLCLTRYGVEYAGGFDALYDEAQITPEDYYQGSSYGAMLRGDCGYLKVENYGNPDGPVVAVIRESFAGAVGPYLALSAGELHLLDARYYDGSMKELLEEIQPDVVVTLLNVQCYVHAYFDMIQ